MGTRCADHVTPLYPQKLALTSPTDGGRSVGIVHSRTKATEFIYIYIYIYVYVYIYIYSVCVWKAAVGSTVLQHLSKCIFHRVAAVEAPRSMQICNRVGCMHGKCELQTF